MSRKSKFSYEDKLKICKQHIDNHISEATLSRKYNKNRLYIEEARIKPWW